MSVALKLQAMDDRNGKQQNFLVSPLAVAGALGQLMLGAEGKLRHQIAVLLTLNEEDLSKWVITPVCSDAENRRAIRILFGSRRPSLGRRQSFFLKFFIQRIQNIVNNIFLYWKPVSNMLRTYPKKL